MENSKDIHLGTVGMKYIRAFNEGMRSVLSTGGTRSGKTFEAMVVIHLKLMTSKEPLTAGIAGLSVPITRKNLIKPYLEIAKGEYESFNKMEGTLVYPNGSVVYFLSHGQAHAEEVFTGTEFDWFLGDELNLSPEIDGVIKQVMMRLKSGMFIMSQNPSRRKDAIEEFAADEQCMTIHSTYKDNIDNLPVELVKYIERRGERDERFKKVYLEGRYAPNPEGAIFSNWEITNKWPDSFKWRGFGLDFGYQHPNALVESRWYDGELYVRTHLYQNKMSNDEIYEAVKDVVGRELVMADSAEPKTIAHLSAKGLNITGVKKGPGSVVAGIKQLQNVKINVWYESLDMIRELEDYSYKKINGVYTDVPQDINDDALDALSYSCRDKLTTGAGRYNYK